MTESDVHMPFDGTAGAAGFGFAAPADQIATGTTVYCPRGIRVPSRVVLEFAEQYNTVHGHELRGFLSAASGFMPRIPTVASFPSSHAAWDDVIARMPELWRTVALRQALREMPVLGADQVDLPDEFVWRASVALSVFAHSFVRIEALSGGELPPSITLPWAQISARLGRREPHMSYNDLIVYNHRLRDARLPHPYQVENMDLLVPSVDNQEERRFYLTQVEILACAAPAVTAVVRAQEAVVLDDRQALATELTLMLRIWQDITGLIFPKIDPNPLSPTHVDQVVWANTVAPLAVPIKPDTVGSGGAASPIFHLMDAFLGRKYNQSCLGKEVAELREWFPSHHISFMDAVEEISVRDYVAASGDRRLQNLFAMLFDAYAGKKGYLGLHRRKVYGFLELAFKVGRSKVITGIVGGFKEKHWKTLDAILEETRLERYRELPSHVQHARIRSQLPAAVEAGATHVLLDAAATGVMYRPGDRCGVLPTNRPEVIEATVRALGATGKEMVPLTVAWREAVRYRAQHPASTDALPLRTFLSYAKLRPLADDLATALLRATASPALRAAAEGGAILEQWELSDALTLLGAEGYRLEQFLTARVEDERALARVVPPESFRMYSISSAPAHGCEQACEEVRLTVAHLSHQTDPDSTRPAGTELLGTASTFLTSVATADDPIPFHVVRPSRFSLPQDSSRPIVMFAAGVGISPFLGFLAHRRPDPAAAESWLFFGTRTRRLLYGEDEILSALAGGKLALYVTFSAEEGGLRAGIGETARTVTTPAGRLPDVIATDTETQSALWNLLRSKRDGGRGAYFYVCGRAEFAAGILTMLNQISARFASPDEQDGITPVRRLVAEGRYMQDVFSSWTSPSSEDGKLYEVSDVALRTTASLGQWLIINDEVYDMTEFLHLHPGGPRIITENIGLDATTEYQAVLHHEEGDINAMLATYRIGRIRSLDFGTARDAIPSPDRDTTEIPVHELYRCWVGLLHQLTAMSNALGNDWAFMTRPMTKGDDPDNLNALKVQYASNTHQRFLSSYYKVMLEVELPALWNAVISGPVAPADSFSDLGTELTRAMTAPEAVGAARFAEKLRTLYQTVAGDHTSIDEDTWSTLQAIFDHVQREDRKFLANLRSAARDGVMVFEELEARTAIEGGPRLIAILNRIPALVRTYHADLISGLIRHGEWL